MPTDNVVSLDRPQCSQCKAFKNLDELNGYDPLAPIGQKYKRAYCRRLVDCKSQEAQQKLDELITAIEE